jgi:hypothetical protein
MAFINYNTKNKLDIFPGVHSAMEHSAQISYGCVSLDEGVIVPIHNHPHEQWTYIVEGQMEFTLEGESSCCCRAWALISHQMLHMAQLPLLPVK